MRNAKRAHGFLLFICLLGVLGANFLGGLMPKSIFEGISQYLLLLVPALFLIGLRRKNPVEVLRLRPMGFKSLGRVWLLSLAMQPLIMFLSEVGIRIFGDPSNILFSETAGYGYGKAVFLLAVTPAICEEVVFRGVIADYYKRIGFLKAMLMSGFLFGLYHMNPYQFLYTFFIGIFAYCILRFTDSILAPILLHFFNNFYAVSLNHYGEKWQAVMQHFHLEIKGGMALLFFGLFALLSLVLSILILLRLAAKTEASAGREGLKEAIQEPLMDAPLWITIGLFVLSSFLFINAVK